MKDETAILELPRLDQHQGGRCDQVERHLFGEDDVHIKVSVFNQVDHEDFRKKSMLMVWLNELMMMMMTMTFK